MDLNKLTERLKSDENILNQLDKSEETGVILNIKDNINRPGPKKINKDTKELLGTLAHFDRQGVIAKAFGVSNVTVSNAKNAVNSSGPTGEYDGELAKKIEDNVTDVKKKVGEKALSKLTQLLDGITEDKIANAKIGELSLAAANLGKLGGLGLEEKGNSNVNNNFAFFIPRQKEEDDYEVINVA